MRPLITITKEVEFDAGHRVPSHGSKCRNPHGHRYRIRVACMGAIIDEPGQPDDGMLVDFGDLKGLMMERVHDVLDHSFIFHTGDDDMRAALAVGGGKWLTVEFPYVPTAENIARWCWEQLEQPVEARFRGDLWLHEVAVWETPTSVAYYKGTAL